jgi:hypothetical protein
LCNFAWVDVGGFAERERESGDSGPEAEEAMSRVRLRVEVEREWAMTGS